MFLSLSLLLFIINKSLWVRIALLDIQEEIIKLGGLVISAIILAVLISLTEIVDIDLNWIGRFLAGFLLVSLIIWINNLFQSNYIRGRRLLQTQINKYIEDSTLKLSIEGIRHDLVNNLSELFSTKDVSIRIFDEEERTVEEDMLKSWWNLRKRTPIINREILIESYFDKENNREISKELFQYLQQNNIDIIIPLVDRNH